MDWLKLPIDRVTITIAGTIWWLCISIALSYIFPWFLRIFKWLVQKAMVEDTK
jgi:hypothetical protein